MQTLTQVTADIRLVSDTASAYLTHWASSVHPALNKQKVLDWGLRPPFFCLKFSVILPYIFP